MEVAINLYFFIDSSKTYLIFIIIMKKDGRMKLREVAYVTKKESEEKYVLSSGRVYLIQDEKENEMSQLGV